MAHLKTQIILFLKVFYTSNYFQKRCFIYSHNRYVKQYTKVNRMTTGYWPLITLHWIISVTGQCLTAFFLL